MPLALSAEVWMDQFHSVMGGNGCRGVLFGKQEPAIVLNDQGRISFPEVFNQPRDGGFPRNLLQEAIDRNLDHSFHCFSHCFSLFLVVHTGGSRDLWEAQCFESPFPFPER